MDLFVNNSFELSSVCVLLESDQQLAITLPSDVRLLCRICANPSDEFIMIRLFDDAGAPLPLAETFLRVSGMTVQVGDSELPKSCCLDCNNRLLQVEDLRKLCQESDRKLREMINVAEDRVGQDVDGIPNLGVLELEEFLSFLDETENQTGSANAQNETGCDALKSSEIEELRTEITVNAVPENKENHYCSENSQGNPEYLVKHITKEPARSKNEDDITCLDTKIPKRRGRKPKTRDSDLEDQPADLKKHGLKPKIQDPALEAKPKVLKKRGRKPKIRDPNADPDKEKKNKSEPRCCVTCGKVYKTLFGLREHESIHSPVKRFKCQYCGMGFGKRTTFAHHVKKHETEGKFQCNECEKAFYTEKLLNQHIQIRHRGERPFHCKLCPKTYPRASSLYVHVQTFHEKIRKKLFKCEICSRHILNRNGYERHMNSHQGIKLNECTYCGKKYEYKTYLVQHIAEKHQEMVKNLSQCNYCGLGYSTDGYYRKHIIKRHPEHLEEFDRAMKAKREAMLAGAQFSPALSQDDGDSIS